MFSESDNMFTHGFTYSGHAISAAIALANLDIMENEKLCDYVKENEQTFHAILKRLLDIPIVGDVRGAGFFYGIELVKNQATKASFSDEESERILKNFISRELLKEGLYCRADDRGEPVVQLSPPLITTVAQFEEVEAILRKVLTQAATML
jgi:adenosylmethionine-8-amino-7-oxononanoate aminotransferase